MDEILMSTVANLKEENQRLKEQIKAMEFEKDVEKIYRHEWSKEVCEENYDESGLLNIIDATKDLDNRWLHELFLKYGYDYVDSYFKNKHEEWLKSIQEDENEEVEEGELND